MSSSAAPFGNDDNDEPTGKRGDELEKRAGEDDTSDEETDNEDTEEEEEDDDDSEAEEDEAKEKKVAVRPEEGEVRPKRKPKKVGKIARKDYRRVPSRKPKKGKGKPVSTHIWYRRGGKITGFTVSLRVPKGTEYKSTFYMACGWHRGYMGMQVNQCNSERRFLFSCWDDGKKTPVETVDSNPMCLIKNFGGEGTGAQCIRWHSWEAGDKVSFKVMAEPKKEENATIYTGYVMAVPDGEWELMGSFKSPNDGKYLRNMYSFLENFGSEQEVERECEYSDSMVMYENRPDKWFPVKSVRCTASKCHEGDYHFHGTRDGAFVMKIGGTKGCESHPEHEKPHLPHKLKVEH